MALLGGLDEEYSQSPVHISWTFANLLYVREAVKKKSKPKNKHNIAQLYH